MSEKIIQQNIKAYFDYFIEDKYEAGISLKGSEVKSVKEGKISIKDSYCGIDDGEIYLKNCFITPYEKGSFFNPDGKRARKLLLHRYEIDKIIGKIREKGFTLVPTKVYFKGNKVKVEIALAKGKHTYDKRASIKERELIKKAERQIKELR